MRKRHEKNSDIYWCKQITHRCVKLSSFHWARKPNKSFCVPLQASCPWRSSSKVPKVTRPSSGYFNATPAPPPSSETAPIPTHPPTPPHPQPPPLAHRHAPTLSPFLIFSVAI